MNLFRPISRASARAGILSSFSRVFDCKSDRPLSVLFCYSNTSEHSFSSLTRTLLHSRVDICGCPNHDKPKTCVNENISISGNLGGRYTVMRGNKNLPLLSAVSFRNFIHSGSPKEDEMEMGSKPTDSFQEILDGKGKDVIGDSHFPQYPKEDEMEMSSKPTDFLRGIIGNKGRDVFGDSRFPRHLKDNGMEMSSKPMDFVRGIMGDQGRDVFGGSQFPRYNVEQNADIVHIKLLRNNTFITLTDSKGNRKPGQNVSASAGSLPDKGGKSARYGAEAAAEHVGRKARDSGVKSVVMKVNGFTYFKKKRQAITSFREGYTHSRGDQNPIVYIEDTTRRPHNGCRLPKRRRI